MVEDVVYHTYTYANHSIQINKRDTFVSGTNGFNNFLTSILQHEERDTIPTMLTLSPRAPQRILWCSRSQFISAGRDPKNLTAAATIETSSTRLHGPISTAVFLKSSNSQPVSSGHDVIHTRAPFPVNLVLYFLVMRMKNFVNDFDKGQIVVL